MKLMKYIFEYIWLDMEGNSRSKTKVMMATPLLNTIDKLPEWNYDGSSTGQAETGNSEVI